MLLWVWGFEGLGQQGLGFINPYFSWVPTFQFLQDLVKQWLGTEGCGFCEVAAFFQRNSKGA